MARSLVGEVTVHKLSTYKDIRRHTGLSLSTISKYFNGAPIRESNRVAIESAVKELGYRPNAYARALRTKKTHVVGVLLPELDNAFLMSIVAGVEALLRAQGVSILVRAAHSDLVGSIRAMREQMVDAIVIVPDVNADPDEVSDAADGVPQVVLDRHIDGLESDSVTIDNEGAGARAAECLMAFGHHRAAIIVGSERIWTMRGRMTGFLKTFSGQVDVLTTPQLSVPAGYDTMAKCLATTQRPTAVFCANYELTLGAITAATNIGLSIPEELSFVGFDGIEFAQVLKPRMWTLVQPVREMAEAVASRVVKRLEDPDAPSCRIVLPAQLIPGDSVRRVIPVEKR